MNKTLLLALATAVTFSMAALPVSARDEIVTKSQVVPYSDLNLSSDAGIRALYQRIRKAARQVCSQANESMRLEEHGFRSCVEKAVASAVEKVNQPALTAMHQSQSSRPLS